MATTTTTTRYTPPQGIVARVSSLGMVSTTPKAAKVKTPVADQDDNFVDLDDLAGVVTVYNVEPDSADV